MTEDELWKWTKTIQRAAQEVWLHGGRPGGVLTSEKIENGGNVFYKFETGYGSIRVVTDPRIPKGVMYVLSESWLQRFQDTVMARITMGQSIEIAYVESLEDMLHGETRPGGVSKIIGLSEEPAGQAGRVDSQ